MRFLYSLTILLFLLNGPAWGSDNKNCPETLSFTVNKLAKKTAIDLCESYAGKVLLIVNTASKCGLTSQYDNLEALHRKYKSQGFAVLGFPSNDFGHQEPGNEQQIQKFCRSTYGIKFPMFSKTNVRRDNADPLFRTLGDLANEYPQWNFHKYIIDRDGKLIASVKSRVDPLDDQIVSAIEKAL